MYSNPTSSRARNWIERFRVNGFSRTGVRRAGHSPQRELAEEHGASADSEQASVALCDGFREKRVD